MTGHHIDNCNSFFDKCINCLGPHKCFSDKCKEFAQKKIFINRFVLKILIGKKFISSASDILQVGNDSKEDQTSQSSDTRKLNDLIESTFSDKINNLEHTLNNQSSSIRKMKENIKQISNDIPDVKSSVRRIQETLLELNSKLNFEVNSFMVNELESVKKNIEINNKSIEQIYETSLKNNNNIQKELFEILKYLDLSKT